MASRRWSPRIVAYRCTLDRLAQPPSSISVTRSTPASTIRHAQSCTRMPVTPFLPCPNPCPPAPSTVGRRDPHRHRWGHPRNRSRRTSPGPHHLPRAPSAFPQRCSGGISSADSATIVRGFREPGLFREAPPAAPLGLGEEIVRGTRRQDGGTAAAMPATTAGAIDGGRMLG
jgi:hypothetical protein